jgi:hypothetical protein
VSWVTHFDFLSDVPQMGMWIAALMDSMHESSPIRLEFRCNQSRTRRSSPYRERPEKSAQLVAARAASSSADYISAKVEQRSGRG